MDKEKNPETVIPSKVLRMRYRDKFGNPISACTWTRWLNKSKALRDLIPHQTKMYTPKQVKAIYEHLGEPET